MPFKADSILGLYEQICKAPLDCPSSIFVSDSLKNLLTRLLDKDPETRMCLEDAMRHPWVTENEELPLLPPCPVGILLLAENPKSDLFVAASIYCSQVADK